MRYSIALVFFTAILLTPVYGQDQKNPSLSVENIEIPYYEFNRVARDSVIVELEELHSVSWQVIIDNKVSYSNKDGNAVIRFYDNTIPDKFIEIGMGSPPDEKFWVAVKLPELGYVMVHDRLERGWVPGMFITVAYTDRAGLTVNNGERIVASNLDVEGFAIDSYSVHGMEGSTDPPAVYSGSVNLEIISGDPAKNIFSFYPFFLAGGVGVIIAILLVTKRRSS